MGGYFSSLLSRLWGNKEVRVLILGLDGAGKTTILYRLQIGEVVTTIPTIGTYFIFCNSLGLMLKLFHIKTSNFKSGILEDRHLYALIGDVITQTQMLSCML